jgi:hypothetical protein
LVTYGQVEVEDLTLEKCELCERLLGWMDDSYAKQDEPQKDSY